MSRAPYPGLRPFTADETAIFFGRETHTDELLARLAQCRFLAVVGPSGSGKSSLVRTGMLAALEGGMLAAAGAHWWIADLRPGNQPFANLVDALLAVPRIGDAYARHFDGPEEAGAFLQADLRRGPLGLVEVLTRVPPPEQGTGPEASAQASDGDGAAPERSLAQVERSAGTSDNLLVLVDQFEEVFRYRGQAGTADESAAFVALLLASAAAVVGQGPGQTPIPVYVVLTMRSDFLGDCALFEGLPEAINRGLYLIPRLNREQTQEAIEGPAKVFGAQVDPALTTCLLNDQEGLARELSGQREQTDQLPVLQHVLMRIWDLAQTQAAGSAGLRLTLDLYNDPSIGGLDSALSRHADEAFEGLDPAGRRIAETLFRALCERERDGRYVRRPVTLGTVAHLVRGPGSDSGSDPSNGLGESVLAESEVQAVAAVVEAFRVPGRSFLTPPVPKPLFASTVIDISHESLIRKWRRLRAWCDAEAESAEQYRRLEDGARRERAGQVGLLQTPELELAGKWWDDTKPTAAWARRYGATLTGADAEDCFKLAKNYLNRSLEAAERKRLKEEQDQLAGLVLAKRRTVLALIGLALALGLALWGWTAQQGAERERTRADALAASSTRAADLLIHRVRTLFDLQLRSAVQLARTDDYAAARVVLNETREWDDQVLPARRQARNLLAGYVALRGAKPEVTYQQKPVGGEPVVTSFDSLAISPDGRWIAAGTGDGRVVRFDTSSGEVQGILNVPQAEKTTGAEGSPSVWRLFFDPQGQWLLAAVQGSGQIVKWSVSDWKPTTPWVEPNESGLGFALSPDGRTLATAFPKDQVKLINTADGPVGEPLDLVGGNITVLAFNATGKKVAAGNQDGTVAVWDLRTKKPKPHRYKSHQGAVTALAFAPSDVALASAGEDKFVAIQQLVHEEPPLRLAGHTNDVLALAFDPDGKRLYSGGSDRTIRVWDKQSGQLERVLQGHDDTVTGLVVYAGALYSASQDGTVRRWDAGLPGRRLIRLDAAPYAVDVSVDGGWVAVGDKDGTLGLYPLFGKAEPQKFPKVHPWPILSLEFDPDGRRLASAAGPVSGFEIALGDYAPPAGGDPNRGEGVKLWSVKDGTWSGQDPWRPDGASGPAWRVAFDPHGQRLIGSWFNGAVVIRGLPDGPDSPVTAFTGRAGPAALSGDGRLVAASGVDWEPLSVWDLTAATPTKVWTAPDDELLHSAVVMTPDGSRLANGSDRSLRVYRRDITQVDGGTVSPEARTAAPIGSKPAVPAWRLDWSLSGHDAAVTAVRFLPNEDLLVSGGMDSALRVWDLRYGDPLFRFTASMTNESRLKPAWDFGANCGKDGRCIFAAPAPDRNLVALYEIPLVDQGLAPRLDDRAERWRGYVDRGIARLNEGDEAGALQALREAAIFGARLAAQDPQVPGFAPFAGYTSPELSTVVSDAAAWRLDELMELMGSANLTDDCDGCLFFDIVGLDDRMTNHAPYERQLRRVLEKHPDNTLVLNALGYHLAERSDRYQDAHDLLAHAVELEPNDYSYRDSLGWALFKLGQFREALVEVERSIALMADAKDGDPNGVRAEILAHQGEILWALDRRPEAKSVWSKALKDYPADPKLRDTVKRLDKGLLTAGPAPGSRQHRPHKQ